MSRSSLIVCMAGGLTLPGPVEAAATQFTAFESAIAHFDAEVAAGVADDAGGAVSIAVFEGPTVLWSKGWGWADIDGRRPAGAQTIGRTGSISKSFTAVLMMHLVERGVLALDDPVRRYLPEADGFADRHDGAPPVTFRMLASHTAGLIREPDLVDAATGPIEGWEGKILESIPRTRFQTPPQTEYAYSNIGFGTLGLALSRAAGIPFMDLMRDRVFAPLGLLDTFFVLDTPERRARMSVGYERDDGTGTVSADRATAEHRGRGYKVPNGGIYSTVGDLAVFAAAVMGRTDVEIMTDRSRREMLSPQWPADRYGLGFRLWDVRGHTLVGHSGSVAGYNAFLVFDPVTGLGVSMLRTTTYDPPVSQLLATLVDAAN